MSLNLGTLVAYLQADHSNLDSGFDAADKKVQGFSLAVPGYMAVAAAAIIAAGAAATVALFGLGDTFDEVKDGFRINTTASSVELDRLAESVDDIATRIPVSIEKIGPALGDVVTRLGLSGDTAESVAEQFLELGRIKGVAIDIGEASGALNVFKISGDDVGGSLDYLFQVSQSTGIGINELISAVGSAGPITQQLGLNFEETAAMIGVMDKAGLDSQTMIGAMQRGLANMASPGESAEATFARVTGEIQGFIDKGDEASARAAAGEMFGTRGAAQLVGALQTGVLNFEDLIGSAELSSDTIMGVADETQDFGEKWQLFVNGAMVAFEPIASQVFDTLSAGMATLVEWSGPAFAWISENSALLQTFAVIVGSFAAAFLIVQGAVAAYNLIMGIYTAVTTAGSVAQWLLNVAMTANPIGIVVVAIGLLIAGLVLLIMNWDTVVKFLGDTWAGFIGWFTEVMEGFAGWWDGVWTGFIGFVTDVWNGFVGWLGEVLQNIVNMFLSWTLLGIIIKYWDEIVAFITNTWNGFVGWIGDSLNNFVRGWQIIWSTVSSFIAGVWSNIWTGVTNTWNTITGFLASIPGTVLGFFANAGTWLLQTGKNIIDGLLNGLKAAIGAVWNWITDIGQGIADTFAGILGIHSPSTVFRGFGVNIGEGLLQGLADIQPEVDARMTSMAEPPTPTDYPTVTEGSYNQTRNVTVVMQSDKSALDEEDIFAALDRDRGQ